MHFGFQHGDGWFDLLWRLCERLDPVVAAAEKETGRQFEVLDGRQLEVLNVEIIVDARQVLQVKEKFGALRFYANYNNDAISTLIEAAAVESFYTCEVCGQPGKCRGGSWVQTLCDDHRGIAKSRHIDPNRFQ